MVDKLLSNVHLGHFFNVFEVFLAHTLFTREISSLNLLLGLLRLLRAVSAGLEHRLARTELLHTLFLLLLDPLFTKLFGPRLRQFVVRVIQFSSLLFEGIDKNSQEQVKQDKVANKDPRNVVDCCDRLENHVTIAASH